MLICRVESWVQQMKSGFAANGPCPSEAATSGLEKALPILQHFR